MPEFSELETTALCLGCGKQTSVLGDVVKFQWGKIPHRYKLNDEIVWLVDKSNNPVPPFAYIKKSNLFGDGFSWNCGEPQYKDLFVFDTDPHITNFVCTNCNRNLKALAVEIRNGRIVQAIGYDLDNLLKNYGHSSPPASIIIIRDDGTYWAREDWDNPSFN